MSTQVTPDDPRMQALRARIDEISHDAQDTSTWGLFFLVIAALTIMVTIFLLLVAGSGGSSTPAVVAALIAGISMLIVLLEQRKEWGLIKRLGELRRQLKALVPGGGSDDGK